MTTVKEKQYTPLRFAAFDIETTALEGSFGRLVCACFKFNDEDKPRTVSVRKYRNEPNALTLIKSWYNEADVIYGWNSKLFDVPFVNARLMHHGHMPLTPSKMHKDLMYEAKKMRLRGARLENVSKDLRTEVHKYDVPAWRWTLAAEGDVASIAEIVKHCEMDVLLTEEMFSRLRPLIINLTR